MRLSARLTRYKIDVMSEESASQARAKGAEELQKLIAVGLMEDFLREIFLDNHLDSLAVLSAQTPERLVEAFEAHHVTLDSATKLIAKSTELLTPEQRSERDQIIDRRLQAEREAADEEARNLASAEAEALAAAEAEALAATQAAGRSGESAAPTH